MHDLLGFRVAVVATDGFEESELTDPVKALKEAGAKVDIVSPDRRPIQAFRHHDKTRKIDVDKSIGDVAADEYDGLMLPGGALNADTLRADPRVLDMIRTFGADNKPIAAICHAPWELASAGVLKGRSLTSFHTIQDDLRNAGATWTDQAVVRDGNLVTSRSPKDLPEFDAAMIQLFAEYAKRSQPAGASSRS